jgi:hypothetical protein
MKSLLLFQEHFLHVHFPSLGQIDASVRVLMSFQEPVVCEGFRLAYIE